MPKNWDIKRIGDICKTNQRTYSLSENWSFVKYLDTGNLTENRIDEIQHIVVGKDALPSRARRKVALDEILYSTVRPNQRHYGIVKEVLPNMLVSTGFAVITVDKTQADADFLYYYLSQNGIVDTLHAIGEQSVSAYPSIKPSDIEGLELDLPSLGEQIEIGRTLRALDDKITNNSMINHHLEQMAQAIFKSWFVNFEPTFTKLGNVIIAANTGGDAIRKTPIVDFDTGIRCVRVGDMSNKNEPSSWGFCRVSKEDFKKHQLKKGDIVVTRTASLGLNTIIWEDLSAVYNNGLIRLKPNKDCVSPLFLYLTLQQKEYFDYINRITGETSVRPNMKIDYLLNYEFNCPPVDLQNKLVDTIQSFFDRIRCNVAENLHLVTMRDTLLPRLMSGELSVADLSAK